MPRAVPGTPPHPLDVVDLAGIAAIGASPIDRRRAACGYVGGYVRRLVPTWWVVPPAAGSPRGKPIVPIARQTALAGPLPELIRRSLERNQRRLSHHSEVQDHAMHPRRETISRPVT